MHTRPRNTDNVKKKELWHGIVNKAQADGDHSLDQFAGARIVPMYRKLAPVMVASILLVLMLGGYWLYQYRLRPNYLAEQDLSAMFADNSSVSRLVLANGDTILLDGNEPLDSSIKHLTNATKALDFRKLDQEDLLGKVQSLETGRGKMLHAILSDGTEVWLNAASRIEFPARFDTESRNVRVSGEVYFEVAANKKVPFIVHSASQQVKVLGTHFNTRQYREESLAAITLLEGSVEVTNNNNAGQSNILKPAEQLVYQHNKSTIQTLSNPETVVAWRNGDFYFSDADAQTIVKELERWYPVAISLKQADATKKISGRIKRSDSMQEVVDMLRFFDIEILVEQQK